MEGPAMRKIGSKKIACLACALSTMAVVLIIIPRPAQSSNTGFLFTHYLNPVAGSPNIYYVSFPFFCSYHTIDDVLDDYYLPFAQEGVTLLGCRYVCDNESDSYQRQRSFPPLSGRTPRQISGAFLATTADITPPGTAGNYSSRTSDATTLPSREAHMECRSITLVNGQIVRGGNEPFPIEEGFGYHLQVLCDSSCPAFRNRIVGSHDDWFEGVEICPSQPTSPQYTLISLPYHTALNNMDEVLLQILYSRGDPDPGLVLEAALFDAGAYRFKTRTVMVLADGSLAWGGTEAVAPAYLPPDAYRIRLICPATGCPDPPLLFLSPHY
jgi:hypothetical protein